jgi:hypothetical protein
MAPGSYTIKINFYEGSKLVDSRVHENVVVTAGKLNLLEGTCLK